MLFFLSKLDRTKKWQARSNEDKKEIKNRKRIIQKGFRQQLGLIIHQPKPGFGSMNDGNMLDDFLKIHLFL